MLRKSDSNSRANENKQSYLNILFCQCIFDALEKTFGTVLAKRFLDLDSELSSEIQGIVYSKDNLSSRGLDNFQKTFPTQSGRCSDLFREIYNHIFPRSFRHVQGEYYTPSWLANRVLEQLQYSQNEIQTLLDPCCGSGSFLLQGLNQIVFQAQQKQIPITANLFTDNLFGIDINPVSIFACKANIRINVYRVTGIVLSGELNNIRCSDFLKESTIDITTCKHIDIDTNIHFDVIAGNPPWLAWDNLDNEYRHQFDSLWKYYNLFHLTGTAVRYGGSKKDLSELFFYVACSQLKQRGRIGFLLPRSLLFNTASGGFRRWELPDKTPLKIEQIEDYSRLNIFGTYAAKACCVYAQKGIENQYPINYTEIHNKKINKYIHLSTIEGISQFELVERQANLSNPSDKLSIWTVENKSISCNIIHNQSHKVTEYAAHLGANSGGANGVFWLQITELVDKSHAVVRNLSQCSKKEVPALEMEIESALLYPLARWKSIDRGLINLDNTVILVVQDSVTRTGLNRDVMESLYPLTFKYLLHFEELLSSRAAQKRYQSRGEFYSMYNIGQYTFNNWKCVWRRMDSRIRAVAVGPQSVSGLPPRPVFPQETCVFISAESETEANYLSAVMNSTLVNKIACDSSNVGGKGFGSPGLLSRIPLQKFDEKNPIHLELSRLEKQLGLAPDKVSIQSQIDLLINELWTQTDSSCNTSEIS